jgi:hypothetical protein
MSAQAMPVSDNDDIHDTLSPYVELLLINEEVLAPRHHMTQ